MVLTKCHRQVIIRLLTILFLPTFFVPTGYAEVVLDGSLGPGGSLSGPNYVISDDLGRVKGTNLFHSFGRFNVMTGESATFTGPNAIENVIGRVTGGTSSSIDGLLRSTIQDANLFLINPSGVMFGPNATLDVNGSFHVSTADYIRLSDDGVFYADPALNSVLTVAPPSAFGFLGDSPAAITIDGSFLEVIEGETLSVVGGGININDGTLYAPSGRINLAGVGSQGEVTLDASGLEVDTFENLGTIHISHSSSEHVEIDGTEIGNLDVSGETGGTVYIRGGRFTLDGGYVFSSTYGTEDSNGSIDIGIDEDVSLHTCSKIKSQTGGSGDAGDIVLNAASLTLMDGTQVETRSDGAGDGGDVQITSRESVTIVDNSGFYSRAHGEGNGGDIVLDMASLTLMDEALIETRRDGAGDGGDVQITSRESVSLSDSRIYSRSESGGNAGDVFLNVRTLSLSEGAKIDTITEGAGDGGNLSITAEESVIISGQSYEYSNGLFSKTDVSGISLDVGTLTLTDEAKISTSSLDSGDAGELRITAESVSMSGSDILSETESEGNAGDIFLDVGTLTLTNGAEISSDAAKYSSTGHGGNVTISATKSISMSGRRGPNSWSLPQSGISSDTWGSGDGGTVSIYTPTLILDDDGKISAKTWEAGKGGEILLDVETLTLTNGAEISCESHRSGKGGNITVNAAESVSLTSSSILSDTWGSGDGGTISISTPTLILDDRFGISAEVRGSGRGGNIFVDVRTLTLTKGAKIRSDTDLFGGTGQLGNITISATNSVSISGRSSTISSDVRDTGDGGTISISTPTLILDDRGSISTDAYLPEPTPWDTPEIGSDAGNAGEIRLDVGTLTITNGAEINCGTHTPGQGGKVTIAATDSVSISDSEISSNSYDVGNGGTISISTPTLILDDNSEILAYTTGAGQGGEILVDVGTLNIQDEALISASTGADGEGGDLRIRAEFVFIYDSGLHCQAQGDGNAGVISLDVGTLTLMDGAQISVSSSGTGDGGTLTVHARDSISVSGGDPEGHATGFFSDAESEGNAGDIFLDVGTLIIRDVGQISASSRGAGEGGTLTVHARDSISISGCDPEGHASGLFNIAESEGNAGGIFLDVGTLSLTEGAQIFTGSRGAGDGGDLSIKAESVSISGYVNRINTEVETHSSGSSGLFSGNFNEGSGGNILLQAEQVLLSNSGKISAQSTGSGNAGSITMNVSDTFQSEESSVTTESRQADGGDIQMNARYMVHLLDSEITASVGGGPETVGGNITIDPEYVILDGSKVIANAFEGRGGNIMISAGTFLADPDSSVSASSALGIDGTVDIDAPDVNITGIQVPLPKAVFSAADLLQDPCIARLKSGEASTFIISGRDGLPIMPGQLLPSPVFLGEVAEK